jgi:glycosyltransferase involved in cell wall biosynthesis
MVALKEFIGLARPQKHEKTPLLDFLGDRHLVLDRVRPVMNDDLPDANIIVATWWETAPWVSELSSRKGRKFYFLQDYEVFPNMPTEKVIATYSLPLRKIAVSAYIQRQVTKQVPDSEIAVIPNAVDVEHFKAAPRQKNPTFTLGFLYTETARKNVSFAVEVAEAARSRIPNIRVLAFGAQEIADYLPIPNWVEYHKTPIESEIPGLYAKCDLWLFTSSEEGFGLPILEAMACGTPVLATNAGAAENLINGSNGFLLDAKVDMFVDQIVRIKEAKPSEWREMSEAARMTATDYTWDDATDRLLEVFENN